MPNRVLTNQQVAEYFSGKIKEKIGEFYVKDLPKEGNLEIWNASESQIEWPKASTLEACYFTIKDVAENLALDIKKKRDSQKMTIFYNWPKYTRTSLLGGEPGIYVGGEIPVRLMIGNDIIRDRTLFNVDVIYGL